jgi:hypothetical protein
VNPYSLDHIMASSSYTDPSSLQSAFPAEYNPGRLFVYTQHQRYALFKAYRFFRFPSLVLSKILYKHIPPKRNRDLYLGLNRVELLTPSLSEKCSNRLSYRPKRKGGKAGRIVCGIACLRVCQWLRQEPKALSRRKEVIQPHLPVRLPCYDFTLLTKHTFDVALHCWLS